MTITYDKQILIKRGNTASVSSYVGPLGELVLDTDTDRVYVHDGATAGGILVGDGTYGNANVAAYISTDATIVALVANAGVQSANIATLTANAAAQAGSLASLEANAAVQSGQISQLQTDITTANTNMKGYVDNSISANITAIINGAPGALDTLNELANALGNNSSFSTTITNSLATLTSNAAVQAGLIADTNTAITTANLAMKGYVDSQSFYSNAKVASYLPTYNGNIKVSNVTFSDLSVQRTAYTGQSWRTLLESNLQTKPTWLAYVPDGSKPTVDVNFGFDSGGMWFTGNANDQHAYPIRTNVSFYDTDATEIIATFDYDSIGDDHGIAIFNSATTQPFWVFGTNASRIAWQISTATPELRGQSTSSVAGAPVLEINNTYTVRMVYDPLAVSNQVTVELYQGTGTAGTLLDTRTINETLPAGAYEVGFDADQDNLSLKSYFTALTIRTLTNAVFNDIEVVNDLQIDGTVTGNLIPSANVTYDLGSETAQWRDLWLSGNTIHLGSATLSVSGGAIQSSLPISANLTATNITVQGTRIEFASGGYIEEAEVFDGNANPLGYYAVALNSSDDGLISMNALDSNAVATSSVIVSNVSVQLNVANSTPGGNPLVWNFDNNGILAFPGSGSIDGSDFDIDIAAGNDGASTYGTISLITNNPSGTNTLTFNSLGELNVSTVGANDGLIKWEGNSSGDGNGYTTMVLVPDTTVEGNDQYLIIDPTEPTHIHIRAGGTQDNSNSALFLGGENSHVEVQAGENPPVYVRANNNEWMFDVDGSLTIPGSIEFPNGGYIEDSEGFFVATDGGFAIQTNKTAGQLNFSFGADGTLTAPGDITTTGNISGINGTFTTAVTARNINADGGNISLNPDFGLIFTQSNAVITANTQSWTFDTNGKLTAPGEVYGQFYTVRGGNGPGTEIGGLGYGGNVVTVFGTEGVNIEATGEGGPQWQFGESGDLSVPGDVQFADDSIITDNLEATGNFGISTAANVGFMVETNDGSHSWLFGADGNLTIPGDIHGAPVMSVGPTPSQVGRTVNITPADDAGDKTFGFRIDQYGETFTRAYLQLPTAEVDKQVAAVFPHTNTTAGYIFTQGTNTNDDGMNDAFNIFYNNGDIKITSMGSLGGLYTWKFGDTGNLTVPGSVIFADPSKLSFLDPCAAPLSIGSISSVANIAFSDNTYQTTAWTGTVAYGNTIAIGYQTGITSQGNSAVAIGSTAGNNTQGIAAVALGEAAGRLSQGVESIAVGKTAGEQSQGAYAIAIGSATAYYQQGIGAVAIGTSAGALQQGDHAVAIGTGAGNGLQGNNSIILNATGNMLDQTTANTFTVAPIRNTTSSSGVLQYNNSTSEVTYANTVALASGTVEGFAIGYKEVPQVAAGNVTLALSDSGKHYYSSAATPTTLTIPSNANVAFPIGTAISIVNAGTGNITIGKQAEANLYLAGNTTNATRTLTSYGMATVLKTATDQWFISGSGLE